MKTPNWTICNSCKAEFPGGQDILSCSICGEDICTECESPFPGMCWKCFEKEIVIEPDLSHPHFESIV